MNKYTNTKKTKKFILALVFIMLFTFCCPKQEVKAISAIKSLVTDDPGGIDDIAGILSNIVFQLEYGVINFLNELFCDDDHQFSLYDETDPDKQTIKFSAENIIKGKFLLFDANIFKDVTDGDYYDRFEWLIGSAYVDNMPGEFFAEGAKVTLRNTIAGWYYSLRNFAIVALLSVLVYVGIRMIMSTVSQDKAKYKVMFKDWLIALCLLMVMHYIMIGVLNITSIVTEAIGTQGGDGTQTGYIISLINNINAASEFNGFEEEDYDFDFGDNPGDIRYVDPEGQAYFISDAYALEFLLFGIVLLTFVFAWKYLKREFTIIFLILLGPISCITYPIDKISDGKAQAFNKWLTEFVYNVLVQPFHLLLYVVLCGSAIELANRNVIYGIACLGIIIPAEKFVKEMFGFKDRLGGGPLSAMATGALGSHLLNKLKSGGSSGGNNNNNSSPDRIHKNHMDYDALTSGDGSTTDNGQITTRNNNGPTTNYQPDNSNQDDSSGVGGGPMDYVADNSDQGEGSDFDDGSTNYGVDGNSQDGETLDNVPTDSVVDGDSEDDGININDEPTNYLAESGGNIDNQNNQQLEDLNQDTLENNEKNVSTFEKLKNHYHLNQANKHGTTDKKEIRKEKAKGAGRKTLRVAGGVIGAYSSVVFGKGLKGAVAGGITGGVVGDALANKAYKTGEKHSEIAKGYRDALRTQDEREKIAKEKDFGNYISNSKNRDNATMNFKETYGREPSRAELNQELRDRYELAGYNLSNDQIDDLIADYQDTRMKVMENKAIENGVDLDNIIDRAGGIGNLDMIKYRSLLEDSLGEYDIDSANKIAGSQAKYVATLGKNWSAKDFTEKPDKIYNNVFKTLSDYNTSGASEEEIDRMTRQYIMSAAKLNSVGHVELPPPPQSVLDRNSAIESLSARGVVNPNNQQIQREVANRKAAVTRLNSRGIATPTEQQIRKEVVDGSNAAMRLMNNGIDNPTNEQINKEIVGRAEAIQSLNAREETIGGDKHIQNEMKRIEYAKQRLNSRGISKPTEVQVQKEIADVNGAVQRLRTDLGVQEPTEDQINKEISARNEAIRRVDAKGITDENARNIAIEETTEEMRVRQEIIDENGYTEQEIRHVDEIVELSGGSYQAIKNRIVTVETDFKQGNAPKEITEFIGQDVTLGEARMENIERLKVEYITNNISPEKISSIRSSEVKVSKGDPVKIQEIRNIAQRAIQNNNKITGRDAATASPEVIEVVEKYVAASKSANKDNLVHKVEQGKATFKVAQPERRTISDTTKVENTVITETTRDASTRGNSTTIGRSIGSTQNVERTVVQETIVDRPSVGSTNTGRNTRATQNVERTVVQETVVDRPSVSSTNTGRNTRATQNVERTVVQETIVDRPSVGATNTGRNTRTTQNVERTVVQERKVDRPSVGATETGRDTRATQSVERTVVQERKVDRPSVGATETGRDTRATQSVERTVVQERKVDRPSVEATETGKDTRTTKNVEKTVVQERKVDRPSVGATETGKDTRATQSVEKTTNSKKEENNESRRKKRSTRSTLNGENITTEGKNSNTKKIGNPKGKLKDTAENSSPVDGVIFDDSLIFNNDEDI